MEKLDYIIIGAGIAGLHTAYRLSQQGKKVLVLEKESYIGGRMSSHEIDGDFVDFGAKFIAPNLYKNMVPLAKELGVEPVPINITSAGIMKDGHVHIFDGEKRLWAALTYKGISLRAKLRLALGIAYTLVKYRNLSMYDWDRALYLDDKSVYDALRNLVGAESYDHTIELFCQDVVFYSTKEMSRAALYAILHKLIRMKGYNFPRGIGQLCEVMAAKINVANNIEVKSVIRSDNGIVVKAVKNGGEIIYEARNVVLAVPGNNVFKILTDPLPEEKDFFTKVQYASTVQVLCKAKTDVFDDANAIWFIPKEKSSFTSLGRRGRVNTDFDSKYFNVALRSETYEELAKADNLNADKIKELVLAEFPTMEDLNVIRIQIWDSATPILYPGYITSATKFLNRSNWNNGVYFCGDYLENPSTEGALTSSINLLKKINNHT